MSGFRLVLGWFWGGLGIGPSNQAGLLPLTTPASKMQATYKTQSNTKQTSNTNPFQCNYKYKVSNRMQNADRERSASPKRRGGTPLNPPSSDVTLLSDPPVSPAVSSSQDMVRTRSGFDTNDSAPSRSSGCCKRALKELLLFAMDLIILLVGVLQGPISVRILLALVAYTSAIGSPRCLSLLRYLILLRCLSLLGCLNLLRNQKF